MRERRQHVGMIFQSFNLFPLLSGGKNLLLVTHEINFARMVSDRVIFMHQGRVHAMGTPAGLFDSPQTPELQRFLSSIH